MTKDNWIWLDEEIYPESQKSPYTGNWGASAENDTVVEFSKSLMLEKEIDYIHLIYSADALIQLYVNGRFLGTGPVSVGGDFLANDTPRNNRYASELFLSYQGEDNHLDRILTIPKGEDGRLKILARVRLCPVQINEFSMGKGGFMLKADIHLSDGEIFELKSDEDWVARVCPAYATPGEFDGRLRSHAPTRPKSIEDIWRARVSPLPHRVERYLPPKNGGVIALSPGEKRCVRLEYDKIYAGYTVARGRAKGEVDIRLAIRETDKDSSKKEEHIIFTEDCEYIGARMYSFGIIDAIIENRGSSTAEIEIGINEAYLPYSRECLTRTSDEGLNKILEVCRHTLKYCRQYIHLDSPKHCEPSACTGDYYIEAMMTSFSFGDMALADFDLVRTAETLKRQEGEMFHPTYSLIWVRMLIEVYKRCGRLGLLQECRLGLDLLLNTFKKYICEGGIIDTPPNYMFVDWIYLDGISLHHPPKALGQSVMNMFYFDALNSAAEIYSFLGEATLAESTHRDAETLKEAIIERLYDKERGLFFEGENTETPERLIAHYMPTNVKKRYYRINANALAVATGIIEGEEARRIMRYVLGKEEFSDYQPYFAHFVLSAVHRAGLDEELLFPILDKWLAPIAECDKGLAEGFIPPEPTYSFDHSHAWGGTPLYSLPMALTSLNILEPGMTKISITPRLLGIEWAEVEIPTPKGIVTLKMKKGEKPIITAPKGVTVEVNY